MYPGGGAVSYLMPLGKHNWKPLPRLPDDYFEWLRTLDLRDPLARHMAAEVSSRAGRTASTAQPTTSETYTPVRMLGLADLVQ